MLVVVATVAPRCFANWMANVPTPPEPAWIRIFCPFSQIGFLDQHLPGGQPHQGDGSRFLHGEVLRFQRHVGFVHGNELRERADPAIARPSIDLVTRLELPDLGPDPNHGSGHVVPQDEGRAIRQDELELSIPDLRIQKIEPGRVDLDQDIVIPQRRLRHLAEAAERPSSCIDRR